MFVITRLESLARSTRDLLNIVAIIDARGDKLRSLVEPCADITTPVSRLMLTVFGSLAEFERSPIQERKAEGRQCAKRDGCLLCRKVKLAPHRRADALRMREGGNDNAEIARVLNVHGSTITRLPTT